MPITLYSILKTIVASAGRAIEGRQASAKGKRLRVTLVNRIRIGRRMRDARTILTSALRLQLLAALQLIGLGDYLSLAPWLWLLR